jgi:UPF0755 protein
MNKKKILYISAGVAFVAIIVIAIFSSILFGSNITVEKGKKILYIPTGSSFEQVMDTINSNLKISNKKAFLWLAEKRHYPEMIKPGRYVISKSLSYNSLISLLRSGKQTPVRITFNNVRTINDIAGRVGKHIEADSASISMFFSDTLNFSADGFKRENVISVFIPNTYEMYWNTDARSLYTRMLREFRLFWNDKRLSEAKDKGLSPQEVITLASIIDDEVAKNDEKPRIAGVYLNRIHRGMPLQACPTIKFALQDFTITRILNKYLTVESPYNTYIHSGFPPGPIGCASIEGIEAVLNAENHDFIFFAAKADFSGYHNFSRTLAEHNRYAALYQRELDKRKIFR